MAGQSAVGVPGCMQNSPLWSATGLVSARVERLTDRLEPVFVSLNDLVVEVARLLDDVDLVRVDSRPPGVVWLALVTRGRRRCCRSSGHLDRAATLRSPAPCSVAGAPMSVAVLVRICLTRAGAGRPRRAPRRRPGSRRRPRPRSAARTRSCRRRLDRAGLALSRCTRDRCAMSVRAQRPVEVARGDEVERCWPSWVKPPEERRRDVVVDVVAVRLGVVDAAEGLLLRRPGTSSSRRR